MAFAVPAPKSKKHSPVDHVPVDNSKVNSSSGAKISKSKYQVPDWAADLPPNTSNEDVPDKWRLEILKNGVPIGFIDASTKTKLVLGRQGDGMCDAVLEHESISRQHAVIQHHREGSLWLIDLSSTHGTMINKRKILPNAFEQIRPGDVIKFGDSQRLYLVHGPEFMRPPELESENLAQVRDKLNARRQRQEERQNGSSDARALAEAVGSNREGLRDGVGGGIGWGMSPDEVEAEGQDDRQENEEELPDYLKNGTLREKVHHSISISGEERSQKDEELWNKLQVKVQKQNNIEEENQRILSKEGGMMGLSEGQRRQVTRNEERIATLQEEVAELEDRIRNKNVQRGESRKGMNKSKANTSMDDDDDDDDFYDRTKNDKSVGRRKRGLKQSKFHGTDGQTSNHTTKSLASSSKQPPPMPPGLVGKVLTEELLTNELSRMEKVMEELTTKLEESDSTGEGQKDGQKKQNVETEDELSEFMKINESVKAKQERGILEKELEVLKSQTHTVKALLKVAAPALSGLSLKSKKTNQPTEVADDSTTTTTTPSSTTTTSQEKVSLDTPPTPVSIEVKAEHFTRDYAFKSENHGTKMAEEEDKLVVQKEESQQGEDADIEAKTETEERTIVGVALENTKKRKKIGVPVSDADELVKGKSNGHQDKPHTTSSTSSTPLPQAAQEEASSKKKRTVPLGPTMPPPSKKGATAIISTAKAADILTMTSNGMGKVEHSEKQEELEGGDLNWCPPINQSGDGKTHLNAKFGY